MIPYGRQNISKADVEAVIEVLESDYLTQGPVVPRFERAISDYTGSSHAVATNSATSALHLACLALGLKQGDIVWTSPITFVASANCARYCGASVDFIDVELETQNICMSDLEDKLEKASKSGQLPKIVIPVHFAGLPCDMIRLQELSRQYGFRIIEDASHAIGSQYQNLRVGGCQHSDVAIFSFHPVKIITTAEGGVATTNDPILARRMTSLRSHGVTRETADFQRIPDGPWYYEQQELGFNYRMTEIQGALGLEQLKRLDQFVARRHRLAELYDDLLARLPLSRPSFESPTNYSALHLYTIRLKLDEIKRSRREIFDLLRSDGIGVNVHYIPVYLQPYYRDLGFKPGACPNAEKYYYSAISLPLFPDLKVDDLERVVDSLRRAIND